MQLVYVMDPVEGLLPDKDTTFAFQRAAAARGHENLHALKRDVFVREGEVFASVRPVQIGAPGSLSPCTLGEAREVNLADVGAVLIRKDPPFDAEYLYTTLLLERLRGRTLLVNDPRGLRDANEKLYTLHFSSFTPRTMVTADRERILAFMEDVGGSAVVKPLDGAGGTGVMMLSKGDRNNRAILDMLTFEGKRFAMVQEYLPAVRQGDKRVLLLDGQVLGAINRVPRADDLRSNIHVGGRVEPTEVTDDERAVVAGLAPRLIKDGLYFVGLDFIGGKLTEINVTSPTGIQELSRHRGRDVAADVIAWIEVRAEALSPDLRSIPASAPG
jgi:glutathione synthase